MARKSASCREWEAPRGWSSDPEVAADALAGRTGLRREVAAGDLLVGLDVAARRLAADVDRERRRGSVAAVALLLQPAPHVLLVERLGIAPLRERALVAVAVPVARGVRGVDLVDHDEAP